MAGLKAHNFCTSAGAGTYALDAAGNPFYHKGGKLALMAMATWGGGNAQFQMDYQGTWLNVGTSITTTTTPQIVEIPPCNLRVVVTTATAATVSAIEVPTLTLR